jgi:hypothetical protein
MRVAIYFRVLDAARQTVTFRQKLVNYIAAATLYKGKSKHSRAYIPTRFSSLPTLS